MRSWSTACEIGQWERTKIPKASRIVDPIEIIVIQYLSGGLGERNTEDIEVERRGGEQARQLRAGSLKPLQDLTM
jgi:hypothetical protein